MIKMNQESNSDTITEDADVERKENLTDAKSSVIDMEMAKEMMESIENSIFLQPSEAILAQAGHLPQKAIDLIE